MQKGAKTLSHSTPYWVMIDFEAYVKILPFLLHLEILLNISIKFNIHLFSSFCYNSCDES